MKKSRANLAELRRKFDDAMNQAQERCRDAEKLVIRGRHSQAITLIDAALKKHPGHIELRFQKAKALKGLRKIKEAAQTLDDIIDEAPHHLAAFAELGLLHSRFGSNVKAYTLMSRAITLAPDHPEINFSYAGSCQRQGELPKAIDYYKKAVGLLLKKGLPAHSEPEKRLPFNTKIAEELLWETLEGMAKRGVHAFASHGTLLGLVREGGLLPFDKDLDIGVPYSEFGLAVKALKALGWTSYQGNFGLVNPIAFSHKETGISLDLCGFSVEKNTGRTLYGFWMQSIPKEWNRIIELDQIDLEKISSPKGKPVWSAKRPEVIFEPFYGNWKEPDPDFVGIIGEPGLRGLSLLSQCYGWSIVFSGLQKANLRKVKKHLDIMLKKGLQDTLLNELITKIDESLERF